MGLEKGFEKTGSGGDGGRACHSPAPEPRPQLIPVHPPEGSLQILWLDAQPLGSSPLQTIASMPVVRLS